LIAHASLCTLIDIPQARPKCHHESAAMKHLIATTVAAFTLLSHTGAQALSIQDIDLNQFDFDVAQYSLGSNPAGVGDDATASGTSAGIAWSISPTSLWAGRTTTNGTFSFAGLPVLTDNLHPGGNYTITFATPIQTLLVALSNDNTNDSIDFGLTPTDYLGVTLSGTQVTLNNASGGLVLFENIRSFTISNVNSNGIDDGYDLAFHVVATVPEPAASALGLAGMAALAGLSGWRSRRQRLS
jgi:PEP-CTERM motif